MFCLLLMPGQTSALRCANKLVDIGDRPHKVFERCGDPDFVDSYDRPFFFNGYPQGYTHVDIWTYNFGPNRFIQELIFENGVLRSINQLDYGH